MKINMEAQDKGEFGQAAQEHLRQPVVVRPVRDEAYSKAQEVHKKNSENLRKGMSKEEAWKKAQEEVNKKKPAKDGLIESVTSAVHTGQKLAKGEVA